MSTRTELRNCLFGININEGPLYFASPVIKEKFDLVTINENIPGSEILNNILYKLCHAISPQEDIIKARTKDRELERGLREKWNDNVRIWSSFLLDKDTETFFTSVVVKFNNEDKNSTQQYTTEIRDFAKLFEISSMLKFVPTVDKPGYTVDVISCESQAFERLDQFEVFAVKYSGHHPSFDFGHSIFKSFEEARSMLNLAYRHLTLPEINQLQCLAETYSNKTVTSKDTYPNPFIVIEGLDGVGKTTLVKNLTKRLDAPELKNPPEAISEYRNIMMTQCQPLCRAFYSLGNYLVAEDIKNSLDTNPVVLDRFWHSSAAYAIAIEAKCGSEIHIPAKGNTIYQWPSDLLKPSAVIFLELSEDERKRRMRKRGEEETNEELQLKSCMLLRKRLIEAYKNMENPSCIVIDASKSKEEVCENVITELKNRMILPHD